MSVSTALSARSGEGYIPKTAVFFADIKTPGKLLGYGHRANPPYHSALTTRFPGHKCCRRIRRFGPSNVRIRLGVVEEVAREQGEPQMYECLGQLGVAPASSLSGLPADIGDTARVRGRLADYARQRVDPFVPCCCAC